MDLRGKITTTFAVQLIGIFATITEGPILRGAYGPLKVMPSGGPETLA